MNEETLKKVYPLSPPNYAALLTGVMAKYGINTPNRVRAFLAQLGHECSQLTVFTENLNYSATALRSVFGKYFPTVELANQYARKPEQIANRVYANRLGNGDEASGDGWKYRGRGGIQATGKDNYVAASKQLGEDFVASPDLLATPAYAIPSAAWWWSKNGLNTMADGLGGPKDAEVFIKITERVNGGTNGLEDRQAIYERAKTFIV